MPMFGSINQELLTLVLTFHEQCDAFRPTGRWRLSVPASAGECLLSIQSRARVPLPREGLRAVLEGAPAGRAALQEQVATGPRRALVLSVLRRRLPIHVLRTGTSGSGRGDEKVGERVKRRWLPTILGGHGPTRVCISLAVWQLCAMTSCTHSKRARGPPRACRCTSAISTGRGGPC